nr:polyisoprenoid-binding protein [candidate division Zixibacteria bacterium]
MSYPAFAADEYIFDKAHSHIGFKVSHMVLSKVSGNFNGFDGTIKFDENDIAKSSVNVKIDAASINTDNTDRDKHLRSADFFNVEKYPEITFSATRVEKTADGLILHGNLAMTGVIKEVSIPFSFNGKLKDPWGNERIGFEGQTKINRKDFNITWNKVLDNGGLTVGDDVIIDLQVEAVKK